MSLLPCQSCKTPVDSNAKICPKCGRKYPASRSLAMWLYVIGVLLVFGIGWNQCSKAADDIKSVGQQMRGR